MSVSLLPSLAAIVGAAHCLGGAERAPYVVDGRTPYAVVFPGSSEEVARAVSVAATAGVPVLPWGGCILQLASGLRARGRDVAVLHVVEVLDQAYAAAARGRP